MLQTDTLQVHSEVPGSHVAAALLQQELACLSIGDAGSDMAASGAHLLRSVCASMRLALGFISVMAESLARIWVKLGRALGDSAQHSSISRMTAGSRSSGRSIRFPE